MFYKRGDLTLTASWHVTLIAQFIVYQECLFKTILCNLFLIKFIYIMTIEDQTLSKKISHQERWTLHKIGKNDLKFQQSIGIETILVAIWISEVIRITTLKRNSKEKCTKKDWKPTTSTSQLVGNVIPILNPLDSGSSRQGKRTLKSYFF